MGTLARNGLLLETKFRDDSREKMNLQEVIVVVFVTFFVCSNYRHYLYLIECYPVQCEDCFAKIYVSPKCSFSFIAFR